jgi:hypothetical protein
VTEVDEDGGRECPRCKLWRAADAFRSRAGAPAKSCQMCRDFSRDLNRARRERIGAAGVRAENLRTKYGITAEEYDALRREQGYRCAICGRHEDDLPRLSSGRPRLDGRPTAEPFKLVVDHCHHSRRVRGLLCVGRNAAIGHFEDNATALWAALVYLGFPPEPDRLLDQ